MAEGDPVESKSWLDRHLWQIQPLRDIGVVAAIFVVLWLGYKLSVVTVPVLLAITLAYLFEPVVQWLTKQRVFGRQGAAAFIIVMLALVTVVPIGVGGTFAVFQGANLIGEVATDAQNFRQAIDEESEDPEAARRRVSGQPWTWLLSTIENERKRKAELAEQIKAQQLEDTEADADPNGDSAEPLSDAGAHLDEVDEPIADVVSVDSDSVVDAETSFDSGGATQPVLDGDVQTTEGEPVAAQPADADEDTSADAEKQAEQDEADAVAARLARLRADRARRIQELSEPSDIERTVTLATSFIENNASAISTRVARTGAGAFESLVGLLTSLGVLGFTLFLTGFFFFFASTGYDRVLSFGESLIPDSHRDLSIHLLQRFDKVISGFIRGRLTIAFIQSIVFTIAYWVIGVPAPLLLGVGVALLSIVPYAALVGIPVSIVLLWIEGHTGFRGEIWWVIGAPLAVYFIGQALDDYVWTPLIQGKSTGMDTPTILFATLAGGALLGIYGLLLAIPLAACIKILLQEIFWPRFKQWSKGETPDFLPIPKE
ncbi:MAG: AI-2E family transporter [Planctomycetota bacterium]